MLKFNNLTCPFVNSDVIGGMGLMISGFGMKYFEDNNIHILRNNKMFDFIDNHYYNVFANTFLSMGAIMIGYNIRKAIGQ